MVKNNSANTIIIGVVLAVVVLAVLFFVNRSTGYAVAPVDNAVIVSQSVPATVVMGQPFTVSVTMKNTGTTTWTAANNYKLGAQNPQDNTNWGMSRILLSASDSIAPGQTKIFTITLMAPATTGTYNFQWQMVKEKVAWFGSKTTNLPVTVTPSTTGPKLSCYPDAFIEEKIASNTIFVVGSTAPASDTFAVLDVASNLQLALTNPCTGLALPSNPITMIDTEVTAPENYNLILVGTDGYNTLIPRYKLSNTYTYGGIQIVNNEGHVALLILGRTTQGTQTAAKSLSKLTPTQSASNVVCVNEQGQIAVC